MEILGQNLIGWIHERMGIVQQEIAVIDNFWSFAVKAKTGGYWEMWGHGIFFPFKNGIYYSNICIFLELTQ